MAHEGTGIDASFIETIRAKLRAITVEHYIDGRWVQGHARGSV